MKLQKLLFPSTALIILTHAIITFSSFSSQAPGFRTGSPGDSQDCSSCHNNTGVTQIQNVITANIPENGYTPGETYSITVSGIKDEKIRRYGFSVTAEDNANLKVGTFIRGDSTVVNQNHISHYPATTSNDPKWEFEWTAPEAGTGEVTFYGAFVLAKDTAAFINQFKVKTTNSSFQENISTSIASFNKDNQEAYITGNNLVLTNNSNIEINQVMIYNGMGQFISSSKFQSNIDFSSFNKGIYFVNLISTEGIITKTVIK